MQLFFKIDLFTISLMPLVERILLVASRRSSLLASLLESEVEEESMLDTEDQWNEVDFEHAAAFRQ